MSFDYEGILSGRSSRFNQSSVQNVTEIFVNNKNGEGKSMNVSCKLMNSKRLNR